MDFLMMENGQSNLKSCILCGLNEDNEHLFGKFYHKGSLSAHSNCLLFSSGLEQRAKKKCDGILRFLCTDIKKEALRGKRLKCCYCKKIGATIGCILNKCKRSFHFPCGVKHHTLHQHFDNFSSFCELHKPKQKSIPVKTEMYCYICCTSISNDDLEDCLYSPCCKNNWFHRVCLQQYGLSAGSHFFRCPLCNNSLEFVNEMKKHGINIPEKDADWELEENAFQELLYRPECDPDQCECVKGSDHNGFGAWRLLACDNCGSRATHRRCKRLGDREKSWVCGECIAIEARIRKFKENDAAPSAAIVQKNYLNNVMNSSNAISYSADSARLISEIVRGKSVLRVLLKKSRFCDFYM